MDRDHGIPVELTESPHPGEVVNEYLDFLEWSQRDLARRTGLTTKTVSMICNGKASIKPDTALRLEYVLHRPAHLWLNLQRQFDETDARQYMLSHSMQWTDWTCKFPVREMQRLNYSLPPAQSMLDTLLAYFAVASPESWQSVWDACNVSYRQTRKFEENPWAISAWVREIELQSNKVQTASFDEQKFAAAIQDLRPLTSRRMVDVLESVQSECAAAGIAVVCVPELLHTEISGCARWRSTGTALIGLTIRYETNDQMWFSLFHELGHVLLHRNKRPFILDNVVNDFFDRIVDPEMQSYENEANQFAADALIPAEDLAAFVRRSNFTNESILDFARDVGIGPGIVVGRLQQDKYLAPEEGNDLKKKLTL